MLPRLLALTLVSSLAYSQSTDRAVDDLVNQLICPWGTFTQGAGGVCATLADQRKIAENLVQLGPSAAAGISRHMDAGVPRGKSSSALNALIYSYAKLLGPAAVPKLRSQRRSSPGAVVDKGIAQALGLTSIISANQAYYRDYGQNGEPRLIAQPRPVLDHLFLGWQQGEFDGVRADLTPKAGGSLGVEPMKQLWEKVWGVDRKAAALGYVLNGAGIWTEPPNMFEDLPSSISRVSEGSGRDIRTNVAFYDDQGVECGRHELVFVWSETTPPHQANYPPLRATRRYLIDTPDVAGLLELMAKCGQR